MKNGDIVKHFVINQISGFRQYSADVKLISKVGTVPNFWKFEIMNGQNTGKIINGFIYEEDQDTPKLQLTVIEGGEAARIKAREEFERQYYKDVFERTEHLFKDNK